MDGLLRDLGYRAQLELLISQQRYDDIVALLNHQLTQDPKDLDACLFRLLVARILVLRRRLDAYEVDMAPLSPQNLRRRAVSSGRDFYCLLSTGCAALARWGLLTSKEYGRRLAAFFSSGHVLHQSRLRCRDSAVVVYQMLQTRKKLFLQALRRLGLSWGLRAIFIASAAGLVSIAAAICLALLTDFGGRSPAVAQAPGARLQPVSYPVVAAAAPKPDLETLPQKEAPPSTPVATAPSRTADEPSGGVTPAAVVEKSEVKAELARAAQGRSAAGTREKNGAEANLTKPPATSDGAAEKRPASDLAESRATRQANHKLVSGVVAKATVNYRTRQAITIREAARYGAPTLDKLAAGAIVAVVAVDDSWAKVLLDGESTGFVRIEFLEPAP